MFNRQNRGSSHPGKKAGIGTEEQDLGRGLLSGLVWGSILSLMLVWMASQMGGMIEVLKAPEGVAVTAPDAVVVAPLDEEMATLVPEPEAPAAEQGASRAEPEPGKADAPPMAATEPAAAPDAAEPVGAPEGPAADQPPSIPVTSDAPARSPAASQAPSQAPADGAPRIAEAAAVPEFTQPVVVEPQAPAQPEAPEATVPEVGGDGAVPVAPKPGGLPETGAMTESPSAPRAEAAPEPETVPEAAPEPDPVPEAVPEPEAGQEPETGPEPKSQAPRAIDTERTGTLEAAGEIRDLAPNVKVNRLPTIGGDSAPVEPEAEPGPEVAPGGLAIQRFGVPFDNPQSRPVMAIVLIDEGGARPSVADIEAFPFPVSYVVDASRSDAAEAMADYRAAGREVVAMTPLPEGAGPTDVEVSFETYLNRMPEVVAVMDTAEARFQSGRQMATQVAEILAAHGMGMITYSKGLNAATQVADREGVPARLVFREFDNAGQDGAAIQRFLDQAAFRAGQQTGVILVGHNRPETVAALLEWGLGNRAATVALAPVSAALLAQ